MLQSRNRLLDTWFVLCLLGELLKSSLTTTYLLDAFIKPAQLMESNFSITLLRSSGVMWSPHGVMWSSSGVTWCVISGVMLESIGWMCRWCGSDSGTIIRVRVVRMMLWRHSPVNFLILKSLQPNDVTLILHKCVMDTVLDFFTRE